MTAPLPANWEDGPDKLKFHAADQNAVETKVNANTAAIAANADAIASKANDTAVVHVTNDETVAGTKTFSSPVVIPTGTAANHAVTKAQLDAGGGGGGGGFGVDGGGGTGTLGVGVATSDALTEGATNLFYTAARSALKANDADVVHDTGTETIAGVKTFSSPPECATTPTTAGQLARKAYVDSAVAGVTAGVMPDGSVTNPKLAADAVTGDKVAANTLPVSKLDATGVRDSTTALHGDNVFRVPSGGGGTAVINVIDVVQDHGADPTGATNSNAAFLAAITAVAASHVNTYGSDDRAQATILIPPGTYLLTAPEAFMAPGLAGGRETGVRFMGSGVDATLLVFDPPSGGNMLTNDDKFRNVTFEHMSFWGMSATAKWMVSDSAGGAQNYTFNRVNWLGTWATILELTGTNNNSEMKWDACGFKANFTRGIHAPAASSNDQFLNYTFDATHVEYGPNGAVGDFLVLDKGGNVNVFGGSYIHLGDGSVPQTFFKLGVGVAGYHNSGVMRALISGIRVEHQHEASTLIECGWSAGAVMFQSCDTEAWQPLLANPNDVIQAKFHSAEGAWPRVVFDGCLLMGKHRYRINANSHLVLSPGITYRNCRLAGHSRAVDFIDYENDVPTANVSTVPAISFTDCAGNITAIDRSDVFDCTVGWPRAMNATVNECHVSMQKPWGGLPITASPTQGLKLPLNAVITRIRCRKSAGGSATGTTFTYVLTDGAAATIAAVAPGVAWNTAWAYDSGPIWRPCTTDNARTLTLTSANIAETSTDSHFIVSYLA